jgi:predicted NBD/HSP70 family sugar kinase
MLQKATRQHTRDHNSRLILQAIYDAGEISRADLARQTHLTRTTVSDVVSMLIEQGLIQEVGQARSSVGRTPTLLSMNDHARHAIAVSITGRNLRGGVVNLRGSISHQCVQPLESQDGPAVLEQLIAFISGLIDKGVGSLQGIGISTPGLVDTLNGTVRRAVIFGWHDVPLRDLLQQRFQLPISLANDGHTIALAEYMFGQHHRDNNLIAIKVGHGIGAGIVLDGQPFAGDLYGAGEVGHLVVEDNGLPCKCGNNGCLETVASIPAIVHRAQLMAEHNPHSLLHRFATPHQPISFEHVVAAWQAGDPALQQAVNVVGRYLGIGVATMVTVLGIRRVVITGRITPFGDTLRQAILQEVRRRLLPTLAQTTQVEVVPERPEMVLLGAAALLLTSELGLTRLRPPAMVG